MVYQDSPLSILPDITAIMSDKREWSFGVTGSEVVEGILHKFKVAQNVSYNLLNQI